MSATVTKTKTETGFRIEVEVTGWHLVALGVAWSIAAGATIGLIAVVML